MPETPIQNHSKYGQFRFGDLKFVFLFLSENVLYLYSPEMKLSNTSQNFVISNALLCGILMMDKNEGLLPQTRLPATVRANCYFQDATVRV